MKKITNKILITVLALCMTLGLMPMVAYAADNVQYIDENGQAQTAVSATEVTATDTDWSSGWYVVQGNITNSNRIVVTGDVHLILNDWTTLQATQGIQVEDGNSLTIYGQSYGKGVLIAAQSDAGAYTAIGNSTNAAIGGNADKDGGTVTINGGHVTGVSETGAGIGGGVDGAGGTVTINGGNVTAESSEGAGIGGGVGGDGGTVTINSGTVIAESESGAGIGGGTGGAPGTFSTGTDGNAFIVATSIDDKTSEWSGVIFEGNEEKVYGSSVTLETDAEIPAGKTLTVNSGQTLIIARSAQFTIPTSSKLINNGSIQVNGKLIGTLDSNSTGTLDGEIAATSHYISQTKLHLRTLDGQNQYSLDGTTWVYYFGSMSIYGSTTKNSVVVQSGVHNIILEDASINLLDTDNACAFDIQGTGTANITLIGTNTLISGENKAGLQVGTDATVSISGAGSLNATGGKLAAGIGGSNGSSGGNITITGTATVTATAGEDDNGYSGAGIGGGVSGDAGSINISGSANVTTTGGASGAGIGGGFQGDGGVITISEKATVIAKSKSVGAGIGSGYRGDGGNITISDTANVTATGGESSAGIGGGSNGAGGNITISDSATVTATGGIFGSGIGSGDHSAGITTITISGTATVTAKGGETGAGIGGGRNSYGADITIIGAPTITAIGGGGNYHNSKGFFGLHDIDNSIAIPNILAYAMDSSAIPATGFTLGTEVGVEFNKQFVKIGQALKVSFESNGGTSTMSDVIVLKDTQYTLPENGFTAQTGKTFDRWDAGQPGDKITVAGDMTIKAIWKDILSQDLQFANASMAKTMGDAKFTNTLAGAKTTVTYMSTNEDVATVSATGEVTILKAGTTTIVATAKESAEYYEKSAQYSLQIEENAPTSFEDIKDFIASFDVDFKEIAKIIFNNVELKLTKIDENTYELSGYPSGDTVIIGRAVNGSVIVTLNAEFLKTLPQGNYSLSVTTLSAPDTPVATLTLTMPQAPTPTVTPTTQPTPNTTPSVTPETGDDFNPILWVTMLVVSLAAGLVVFVIKKKVR